jgi:transcriptional regulator with PAS, ATPase and Fis domain
VNYFVEKAARALDKPLPSLPLALYQLLRTYGFPGNVRELVDEALRRADGNQGVAALLLGISRQALNKRLARR